MKLTKDDWVEIYAALESKERLVEQGDYGEGPDEDPNDEKWRKHLNTIMEKIGGDGLEACNAYEELLAIVREFVSDIDPVIEQMIEDDDWPDLHITYEKAKKALARGEL